MELHDLMMYAYLGKYKFIEIMLDKDINLFANVVCINGKKENLLIKKYLFKENAVIRANDLVDKLKCLTNGVTIKKLLNNIMLIRK